MSSSAIRNRMTRSRFGLIVYTLNITLRGLWLIVLQCFLIAVLFVHAGKLLLKGKYCICLLGILSATRIGNRYILLINLISAKFKMCSKSRNEKPFNYYDSAPPSYSEIDEKKPLIPKESEETVKQVLGIRRSSFLLSLYLVFYGVFLGTGGLVFTVLEAPEEEELRLSVIRVKNEFLKENACVQDGALEDLLEVVVNANNKGVSAVKNASGEPNWSFGQSLFFSSTVVTTIGYGHVTPLSKAGKCFCIIFGILGIPLTMMLLTALVDRLMVPSTLFLQYLNSKLGHLYQPFCIRLFHLWILFTLLVIFFWLIPASVFAYLEPDWDMFDAVYYCFISLTTIGLGDFIPGDAPEQENRALYKILTTVYLYAGLVFLIFTLTVFYEIPQLNLGIFFLMQADEESSTNIDPEKVRLQTPGSVGQKYTQQMNVTQHAVVKVKARRDDSPSPEETTPVHAIP